MVVTPLLLRKGRPYVAESLAKEKRCPISPNYSVPSRGPKRTRRDSRAPADQSRRLWLGAGRCCSPNQRLRVVRACPDDGSRIILDVDAATDFAHHARTEDTVGAHSGQDYGKGVRAEHGGD